jgi:hypothetical protein
MNRLIPIGASLLLTINGIGALYGGFILITDPSGERMQMPLSLLAPSPFENFLIPGIILLVVNGLFSMVALAALWLRHRFGALMVLLQGVLLAGWLIIQMLLLQVFYLPLHGPFLSIAILLMLAGWHLHRKATRFVPPVARA